ncbi:MAG: TlpA family protein disulfide reductase [Planctomycetota bacterium]|nr:TlpA family protein disulfide reductase [Planctomycetota bacterium]
MKNFLFALVLVFASIIPVALSLDLGDSPPAISPDKWVTGEPSDPTIVDGKSFYLIEVWSTTCPPCLRSIPLLNSLQKRYAEAGLKIVSFTTDTIKEVEDFLPQHPIEYASFIDKEAATFINYMAADNRDTIPHAFLFDRSGLLVWIGNPLDNLESKIKQVVAGTLNGEHAKAILAAYSRLQVAFSEQNIDVILATLPELELLEPDNAQYYQIHLRLLGQLDSPNSDIVSLYSTWYKGCRDNPDGLMILAITAIEQGAPAQRNPILALTAAKRAFALAAEDKLMAGMTLAEVYKDIGRLDLAIQTIESLQGVTTTDGEKELVTSISNFYHESRKIGENPDVEYLP